MVHLIKCFCLQSVWWKVFYCRKEVSFLGLISWCWTRQACTRDRDVCHIGMPCVSMEDWQQTNLRSEASPPQDDTHTQLTNLRSQANPPRDDMHQLQSQNPHYRQTQFSNVLNELKLARINKGWWFFFTKLSNYTIQIYSQIYLLKYIFLKNLILRYRTELKVFGESEKNE